MKMLLVAVLALAAVGSPISGHTACADCVILSEDHMPTTIVPDVAFRSARITAQSKKGFTVQVPTRNGHVEYKVTSTGVTVVVYASKT